MSQVPAVPYMTNTVCANNSRDVQANSILYSAWLNTEYASEVASNITQ